MEYTRYISLDVNAVSASTIVRAKQGDNSTRFINITLKKDGETVSPESGAIAVFRCEKPDGKAVVNSAVINSDGTIIVELTSQIVAAPGRARADICIMKNGKTLSTVVFYIDIEASPDVANRALSDDQFGEFTRAIADAEDVIERAEEAIEEIKAGSMKATALTIGTSWTGGNPWSQTLTISGYEVTENTKVDLDCTRTVKSQLAAEGVDEIYVINNSGVLTVYADGARPSSSLAVQAYLTETIQL